MAWAAVVLVIWMAFPLWKLLGPVMAAILDAFLIIGAVLALFRFRPKAFMAWLKRHIEARNAKQDAKEQQRQQAVWMNRQQPAAELLIHRILIKLHIQQ